MSKVEKHPFDEGKYQSTFDDYVHGKGNGKSRNAIYKHAKKLENLDFVQNDSSKTGSQYNGLRKDPKNKKKGKVSVGSQYSDSDKSVKNDTKLAGETSENAQNHTFSDEIPIWSNDESDETVEFEEWGNVEWDGEEVDVTPHTIPEPISKLNATQQALDYESMGRLVRFGFIGLDRMITHWGRGVMNKPKWELKRSKQDYDVLESSTVQVMAHYGINIPVSPMTVWGLTIGAAYAPPINHIRKNADPNRKRRIFKWPFRRKKKEEKVVVKNDLNEY